MRRRAAGDRLHHGRFHFHEAARVQKIPDLGDDLAALEKNFLHFQVRHQVEITLAIADFRVGEAVPFFRRRTQRFGQNHEWRLRRFGSGTGILPVCRILVLGTHRRDACATTQLNGNLTRFGREKSSTHTDKISQIKMLKNFPLLVAEDIFLRINLDATALVTNVNEHGLAHVALGGDATGNSDFTAFGVIAARMLAGFTGREFVFERVNALGAQCGQLGLALFDQ